MTDFESIVRSFLHNAAAKQWAAEQAAPENPSVDYRTGFAAGREAGEVAALALIVAELCGESVTALIEQARLQASVDSAVPFELHLEVLAGDGEAAADDADAALWEPEPDTGSAAGDAAPDGAASAGDVPGTDEEELVACPTCWLPADVLPPIPYDTNPRSRCPRGHENTLVPAVLEHLRSLVNPPFGQTA